MPDTQSFALVVLVTALAGTAALAASAISDKARLPLAGLLLLGTAITSQIAGSNVGETTVTRVVTIALVTILFDGGMHIGHRRLASAATSIGVLGIAGTFATAALGAVAAHYALRFDWYVSLLVATAVAPTDPAVVFSVLGRRQVMGRSGTVLEGESGANDPVGIALMVGLIGAGQLTARGVAHAGATFALQMGVGAAIGLVGGRVLLWVMRVLPLPGEALYPLRTLAGALLLYGLATIAHGSGFLAVFVAGIVIGDERAPYKREIERFHGALASLGEMVAFVALGLTVNLHVLAKTSTWVPGLVLWAILGVLIRPAVARLCLVGSGLSVAERRFIAFAGLKGAVPILLGGYLLYTRIPDTGRLYGVVIVVVILSVVVQGSLAAAAASVFRLPVSVAQAEPWSLGVRLRQEPQGVHQLQVASGSPADGSPVSDLPGLPAEAWLTLLVRNGQLMPVRGDTVLRAGDRVTVLADAGREQQLQEVFGAG